MVPNSLNSLTPEEMAKRWQEHMSSIDMCSSRIDEYYCHEWNRCENPDRNKYPEYVRLMYIIMVIQPNRWTRNRSL